MTQSFDDLFTDWLEDGPSRASDRVLEAVHADVARAPQRKPSLLRPRGGSAMNSFFKLGLVAAAAIAVIAIAALNIGPAPNANVGANPTPTATPSATPPATTAPSQSPPASPAATPTRYESEYMPWAMDLPAGWVATAADGDAGGSFEEFAKYRPTLVTAGVGSTRPPSGTTIEQYVEQAIETERGNATDCGADAEVTETTLGGAPATTLFWPCDGRFLGGVIGSHDGFRYALVLEGAEEEAVRDATEELRAAFEFTD